MLGRVFYGAFHDHSIYADSFLTLSYSSSVIDTLRKDASLLLAYFYIDYSSLELRKGWLGLMSSLVFQVGTGRQICLEYLQKQRGSLSSHGSPSYAQLFDMFLELLNISGPTALVIDALDELPESTRRDALIPFLEAFSTLDTDRAKTRLFITGRPEPDIWQHCMIGPTRFVTLDLDLDAALQHRAELNAYVSTQLSRLHLSRWPKIKTKAESILVEKSNGM